MDCLIILNPSCNWPIQMEQRTNGMGQQYFMGKEDSKLISIIRKHKLLEILFVTTELYNVSFNIKCTFTNRKTKTRYSFLYIKSLRWNTQKRFELFFFDVIIYILANGFDSFERDFLFGIIHEAWRNYRVHCGWLVSLLNHVELFCQLQWQGFKLFSIITI